MGCYCTYFTMGKLLVIRVYRSSVKKVLYFCIGLLLCVGSSFCNSISIDELHAKGVEAYLENDWTKCVESFTTAANEYRNYVKNTAACRSQCKGKSTDVPRLHSFDIENLYFYETAVKNTLCLLKCKRRMLENKYISLSADLDKIYRRMKPYEYLHLCYYQLKKHQKAASAAFTALVANPENDVMVNNLKFYTDLLDVNSSQIINLEVKDFVPLYIHGIEAYDNGDFSSAIKFFEKSLKKWLDADEECRSYCESPFDQGWLPDFISSVANHFTYCLRCKQRCESSLSSLNGEYHDDLLPSHYNYLQYSYYKVNNLQKACAAVESYLLFYPNDEAMLKNKSIFMKLLENTVDAFHPRKEAFNYVQRQQYEKKLLRYIENEFKELDVSDEDEFLLE